MSSYSYMPRAFKPMWLAVLGLVGAGVLPGQLSCAADFDSTGYGTGVYFSSLAQLGPFTPTALDAFATPNHALSSNSAFFTADGETFGMARAAAGPQGFSVGTFAQSHHPSFTIATGFAGAIAYSGLTVDGDTVFTLPGSVQIEGTMSSDNNSGTGGLVRLAISDFTSRHILSLARIEVTSMFTGTETIRVQDYLIETFDADDGHVTSSTGFLPWTGSVSMPFSIPLAGNNGVVISMFAQVDAGFPNGGNIKFDFLNTATLTFQPPPGVRITLATGQSFGVPEPSTLTLAAIGLGLVACYRRRTARR